MAWLYSGDWTGTDMTKLIRTSNVPQLLHEIATAINERSIAVRKSSVNFSVPGAIWDGSDSGRSEADFYGMRTLYLGYSAEAVPKPVLTYKTHVEECLANRCYGTATTTVTSGNSTGFAIAANNSLKNEDDEHEACFMRFQNMPDLTGKTIVSATLEINAASVDAFDNHHIQDNTYVATPGAWSDSSDETVMLGLSMGSDTGVDLTPAEGWNYIDFTTQFEAIYTADPTPADVTIKLQSSYWAGAITPTGTSVVLRVGALGLGDVIFQPRSHGTLYPRLTIVYEDPNYEAAYMKVQLPDMTDYDPEGAILVMRVQTNSETGTPDFTDVYADETGAWDETSSAGTLAALTFNDPVQEDINDTPIAGQNHVIDIWGTTAKGIRKVYTDDATATDPVTIKLYDSSVPTTRNNIETDVKIAHTIDYVNSAHASLFWWVGIQYTDPNWSDPTTGGMIGQFRRAIETLITPTTIPIRGSGGSVQYATVRFYNFVDTAEWTLSTLLNKGDYGSSWVALNRWQNPDIWMQIKQALEELTYVREEGPLGPVVSHSAESALDSDTGNGWPVMNDLDDSLWAALASGSMYSTLKSLYLYYRTALTNYASESWGSSMFLNESIEKNAISVQSIGTFGSANIFYVEQKLNDVGDAAVSEGYAGTYTVTDNNGNTFNFNPASNGDGTKSYSKNETWADSLLAAGGVDMTWSFTKPGAEPMPTHDTIEGRYNVGDPGDTSDWLHDSGQECDPVSIQINRVLATGGGGLTYG